ncbi:MAG: hypothetical protein IJU41_08440 [Clostridia bacterium]|nr:hypothetical protein [Clostridia bacterium]
MKKLWIFAAVLCVLLTLSAFAADDVVYLDGTGGTAGAYTDLKAAVSALPNGGTIIVSGDSTIGTSSSGVTLNAVGGKVTVTGQNGAVLTLARSLSLASELEINNITLSSLSTSVGRIICNGNTFTVGTGVTTVAASNDRYPSILGGRASGTCTGSHLVIQSGTWNIVYGGNYSGTFNGNAVIDFTGGTIKNALVGGSRTGNFTGNTTVNIGGSAVVEYSTAHEDNAQAIGVVGATMGLKSGADNQYTFNGNTTINIYGNASVASNVLGTRYKSIAMTGDVTVNVYGNAVLSRNIYAGGYYGNITTGEGGIRVILSDNATVSGSRFVCAGALEATAATITGNGYVEFNDNAYLTGAVYVGGYAGTFDGDTAFVMNGGTVTSTVSAGNRGGSVTGTQSVTLHGGAVCTSANSVLGDVLIDLPAGGSVVMPSCTGTVTTQAPEGYEVVQTGTTYTAQEIGAAPVEAPTTVYLDPTGATEGACTTFEDAFRTLSSEGGTIILTGDAQLGTTSSGVIMATYNDFSGKVTITSENDARLIFARSFRINTEVEFDDIHIHSIIPSSLGAVNNIICCGNTLTIGSGVTVTCESGKIYPNLIGGQDASTSYDTHLIVNGGTWRNIWGGGYNGTFSGNSLVEVSNVTVQNNLTAGSRDGTHSGTASLVLDLTGGKTVSATTYGDIAEILVDNGYEAYISAGTYAQQPIVASVEVAAAGIDAFIDTAGRGNLRTVASVVVPEGNTVVAYGVYYIPMRIYTEDEGELTEAVMIRMDAALTDGDTFSADLLQIPAEFIGESVFVIPFVITEGNNVSTTSFATSVAEIVNG